MRPAWILTLCIAGIDAVMLLTLGISVPLAPLIVKVAAGVLAVAAAWYYARRRQEPVVAALLEAAGFLVLFTLSLAIASYLWISLSLPLRDAAFAAADAALGFDWIAHLTFVSERPWLATLLNFAYATSLPQVVFVILALAAARDVERIRTFSLLFAVTGISVIAISGLVPALGAYAYHKPADALLAGISDPAAGRWHLEHFLELRSGSLREIPLDALEGLVSFPSFHTALAIIVMWALSNRRWLCAPAIGLNGAVIVSTLAIGGHYLVDVFAGGAISLAALLVLARRRTGRPALRVSPQAG
ncbi:MAG: phosphatase PAP2 family protein [Beijerinckiaceae bacterium]|jgi:membrane-associated phospholipid phosphatase|nr:phosphatase PAP2 family protein [Beijerinckiaceae bacterium]MDO9443298.1 phosphatase PAP2 family protein [Beijerinckiaceae bacterium]